MRSGSGVGAIIASSSLKINPRVRSRRDGQLYPTDNVSPNEVDPMVGLHPGNEDFNTTGHIVSQNCPETGLTPRLLSDTRRSCSGVASTGRLSAEDDAGSGPRGEELEHVCRGTADTDTRCCCHPRIQDKGELPPCHWYPATGVSSDRERHPDSCRDDGAGRRVRSGHDDLRRVSGNRTAITPRRSESSSPTLRQYPSVIFSPGCCWSRLRS